MDLEKCLHCGHSEREHESAIPWLCMVAERDDPLCFCGCLGFDSANEPDDKLSVAGITVYREPFLVGCKDKDGNPIHAIRLEHGGPVYMVPEYYDRLVKEVERTGGTDGEA